MAVENNTLIEVKNLKTYFFLDEGTVRAIDGVDFIIPRGKILGVVGESGCGKSVTARSILRIVPKPGRIVEGEITLHRQVDQHGSTTTELVNLTNLDPMGPIMRSLRGCEMALVPQEPMASPLSATPRLQVALAYARLSLDRGQGPIGAI